MAWKARIEWVLSDGAVDGLAVVIAAQTLTGTGATVVPSTAAPTFKNLGRGIARVTMISGAALATIDDAAPVETDSVRMVPGLSAYEFSLTTGQILYFVEAADAATSSSDTGSSIFYNDTVANLAASATFTGTSRSSGGVSGSVGPYAYFNATFYSSHVSAALGAQIQSSNDGTTWITEASVALTAATATTLSVPVTNTNYRVVLVNGATLTTLLRINSGFSRS